MDPVITAIAGNRIVAGAAKQKVVAFATLKLVITSITIDCIEVVTAQKAVSAIATVNRVVTGSAVDRIGVSLTEDYVCAVAAGEGIVALLAPDAVRTGPAQKRVVGQTAVKRIVSGLCIDIKPRTIKAAIHRIRLIGEDQPLDLGEGDCVGAAGDRAGLVTGVGHCDGAGKATQVNRVVVISAFAPDDCIGTKPVLDDKGIAVIAAR